MPLVSEIAAQVTARLRGDKPVIIDLDPKRDVWVVAAPAGLKSYVIVARYPFIAFEREERRRQARVRAHRTAVSYKTWVHDRTTDG